MPTNQQAYKHVFHKFLIEPVSRRAAVLSVLVFVLLLAALVYFLDTFYLLAFPGFVFGLYLIPALLNDPYSSRLGQLLAFCRYFPIQPRQILYHHLLFRNFSRDQLWTTALLLVVLVLMRRPVEEILLFWFRLNVALFLPQAIEYLMYFIKTHPKYQFLSQLLLVCAALLVLQVGLPAWEEGAALLQNDWVLDLVLLLLGLLLVPISVRIVHTILYVRKQPIGNNVFTRAIIGLLTVVIPPLFRLFPGRLDRWILLLVKTYLRDYSVIVKFGTIMVAAILITLTSFASSDRPGVSYSLPWLLGLYYFTEFRLNQMLDRSHFARYFPIGARPLRFATDVAGGSLYLLFATLVLSLQVLILEKPPVDLVQMLWAAFGFYLIGICFRVPEVLSKRKRLFTSLRYAVVALLLALFLSSMTAFWHSCIAYALLLLYYLYTYRNK